MQWILGIMTGVMALYEVLIKLECKCIHLDTMRTRLSATVPLLLLHRVSGTVCPMLSVTNSALSEDAFAKLLKTYLMNCTV